MRDISLIGVVVLMALMVILAGAIETDLSSLVQTQAAGNKIAQEILDATKASLATPPPSITAPTDPLVPPDPRGGSNVPPDVYF